MSVIKIIGTPISLRCLVRGTAYSFTVDVGYGNNVSELKEAIRYKKLNDLDWVDPKNLMLWSVNVNPNQKDRFEQCSVKSVEEVLGGVKIENTSEKVGTTFTGSKDNIQVIVEAPVVIANTVSRTRLISVFVDNSNLLLEGKYAVARFEKAGFFDRKRRSRYIKDLHIDHGRLLSTVVNGREMGNNPIIAGSRPPGEDSLWNYVQNLGFNATIYDRGYTMQQKADTALVVSAMSVITSNNPGVLILVAGDGDYKPLIQEAIYRNWIVEIWFWSSGTSGELQPTIIERSTMSFNPLDGHYKKFTFTSEPKGDDFFALEVTDEDSKSINKWGNELLMDCFVSINSFGRWFFYYCEEKDMDLVYLYFDKKKPMRDAQRWLKCNYSNVKVWEQK